MRGFLLLKDIEPKEYLELVHTDACETFGVHTYKSMSTSSFFIDEYSRFGYVYLIHRKSDASNKFIEFKWESDYIITIM